ncbi:MAG: spore coat associated protein CotJA [Bacillota bacterium]
MNGSKRRPLIWNWPPLPGPKPEPAEETNMTVETGDNSSEDNNIVEQTYESDPEKNQAEEITAEAQENNEAIETEEADGSDKVDDQFPAGFISSTTDTNQKAEEERDPLPSQGAGYPPPVAPLPPYTGMILARAYVPIQRYGPLYSPREALERGTLFPELYRPYPY